MIRAFDPWKSVLCTCPPKYSVNPYTGCDHCCVYCYITAYIKDAFLCRPKKDVTRTLERELARIDRDKIISMANSSDPYPRIEKEIELTRKVVELFCTEKVRFQIVTKSDIFLRDIDLLSSSRCAVAVTITTMNKDLAKKLEPGAPSPERRVEALRKAREAGIGVSVRIDPVIPGLTDPLEVLEAVSFADHVTASTLKLRSDGVARMQKVFPGVDVGKRRGNVWYLPDHVRWRALSTMGEKCAEYGISFGTCREGLKCERSCDGTHLVR